MAAGFFELVSLLSASTDEDERNIIARMQKLLDDQGQEVFARELRAISLLDQK